MVIIKIIALILSLGIDTLIVSISLGMINGKGRTRIALVFAAAETVMSLFGILIGHEAGRLFGEWTSAAGGILLVLLAVWLIFFEDDDEDRMRGSLVGSALILTALSISLDELAVGFSIGLIGIPVVITIFLIALQSFFFTMIGLKCGKILNTYIGEWTETLAGIILGALGIWILIEAAVQLAN